MPSAASVAAVTQDYTIELLRSGSTADINSWASEIDAGLLTAAQVATAIGASAEANLYVLPVEQLYAGLFGRVGDSGGLNVWVNQLRGGASFNSVIQSFVNSQEFTNKYGAAASVNATAFVTALYTNILGRAPDAGGLAAWTSVLSTVNVANLATVIQGIVGSAEALKIETSPIDAYLATAGGSGTYASTIAGIYGPAGTASSNPGTTFTLTTGVDASGSGVFATTASGPITGNNNTIIGTFNGLTALGAVLGTPTYNAGDSIVAPSTSTGNTLVLNDIGAIAEAAGNAGSIATSIATTVSNIQTVTINSGGEVTANTVTSGSGFSGLTQLNVNAADAGTPGGAAGSTVTAGSATSITFVDSGQGAQTDSVQGGLNVAVTDSGVTGPGIINVGTVTAVKGTLSVTENVTAGTYVADAINTKGGTTVTVTANLGAGGGATTVTGGAIGITGTSTTTTVIESQTASATAAAAVTVAVPAAGAQAAVVAAPGLNAVAAVTGTAAVAVKAAVQGVVDGAVTVTDGNYNTTTANSITSVSLTSYAAGSAILDNALTSLTLVGNGSSTNASTGTLAITNATNGAGAVPTVNPTLALTLNGLSGAANTITDTNAEITTLNVTTATANSKLVGFTDANLKTLTVAGTNTLQMTNINASLTALTVSGAAGFNDSAITSATGLAALGAALTITDTSSGTFTAAISDQTQTFVGSTGRDVIMITDTAAAKTTITGGSATNNELILEGGAYALAASTFSKVTGFSVLGVAANVTGPIDMSVLGSGYNTLDIFGTGVGSAGGTIVFNKVNSGSTLLINAKNSTTTVNYVDATGVNDTTAVTINAAGATANTPTAAGFATTALTLADANGVGIGTVNISSGGNDITTPGTVGGALNTIATLTDNGLANLTVTGGAGLTIGALNEATTQATAFTLTSNETSAANGTTITAFTDNNLGTLTFAGTNVNQITTLTDTGLVLGITNNGSQTAIIGTIADNLSTLTLGANISLGQGGLAGIAGTTAGEKAAGLQDALTTGVTVSGSADNSHVTVNLTAGAAKGSTDTITLGNGNDYVIDASANGTVKVTVGTGSNLIDLSKAGGAGNTSYAGTVTEGTHTASSGPDQVLVGTTAAGAVAANITITGAVAGDTLGVADGTSTVTLTAAQQGVVTAAGTLAAAVAYVDGAAVGLAAHALTTFTYSGTTYALETVAGGAVDAGTMAAGNTLVALVGTHSITAAPVGGIFTLAT